MNKSVNISLAKIDEIGFVVDLHSRVYTELGYGLPIQKHIMTSLIHFIDNYEQGWLWIAKVNDIKVGTIGLVKEDDQWKIRWFVVDHTYQRLGIGRALLDTLMRFVARDREIEHLELGTINELTAARKLYQEYGFQLIVSTPNQKWKENEVLDEVWEWRKIRKKEG